MHNHSGCICLIFLHCVFSYGLSKNLGQCIQSRTGCICLTWLNCVFSNVSSKHLHKRMHNHIGCICLTFLHCVFSDVSSNCLHERMHNHIGCICLAFLHCFHCFSSSFSLYLFAYSFIYVNYDSKKIFCANLSQLLLIIFFQHHLTSSSSSFTPSFSHSPTSLLPLPLPLPGWSKLVIYLLVLTKIDENDHEGQSDCYLCISMYFSCIDLCILFEISMIFWDRTSW